MQLKWFTDRDHACKDSGDSSFSHLALLLRCSSLRLSVGLVDSANELINERGSLSGVGGGVGRNALCEKSANIVSDIRSNNQRGVLTKLGHDAVDRRLKVGDDGIGGDRTLLNFSDWVGRRQQTKGEGGEEERGDASEQHCCRN